MDVRTYAHLHYQVHSWLCSGIVACILEGASFLSTLDITIPFRASSISRLTGVNHILIPIEETKATTCPLHLNCFSKLDVPSSSVFDFPSAVLDIDFARSLPRLERTSQKKWMDGDTTHLTLRIPHNDVHGPASSLVPPHIRQQLHNQTNSHLEAWCSRLVRKVRESEDRK